MPKEKWKCSKGSKQAKCSRVVGSKCGKERGKIGALKEVKQKTHATNIGKGQNRGRGKARKIVGGNELETGLSRGLRNR